jgi:hypothetical protein
MSLYQTLRALPSWGGFDSEFIPHDSDRGVSFHLDARELKSVASNWDFLAQLVVDGRLEDARKFVKAVEGAELAGWRSYSKNLY